LAAALIWWCLRYPVLWSWRLLLLVTVGVIGTEAAILLMPPSIAPIAGVVLWVVALSLVAFNHPFLWAMRHQDQTFIQRFEARRQELAWFARNAQQMQPSEYAARLRAIAAAFAQLDAPSMDWAL
jgi:hypothetical protein